jgi:hypothetical protein
MRFLITESASPQLHPAVSLMRTYERDTSRRKIDITFSTTYRHTPKNRAWQSLTMSIGRASYAPPERTTCLRRVPPLLVALMAPPDKCAVRKAQLLSQQQNKTILKNENQPEKVS